MIELKNQATWPISVLDYLAYNSNSLKKWYDPNTTYQESYSIGAEYDQIVYGLKAILSPHFIHGFHCTRLTENEISSIKSKGMHLPGPATLRKRINLLKSSGVITDTIAQKLLAANEAKDEYRRGRIWFTFFRPYIAGEWGIRRLLANWGGEALFNSHEEDSITGPILKKIGTPSVIEASLPISDIVTPWITSAFIDTYSINAGLNTDEQKDYEGAMGKMLGPENIIQIVRYPNKGFLALTRCEKWDSPL